MPYYIKRYPKKKKDGVEKKPSRRGKPNLVKKLDRVFALYIRLRDSMDGGGGCENCSACWLGGGSPWDIYQDYIDGKREIKEINEEYMERYRKGRNII